MSDNTVGEWKGGLRVRCGGIEKAVSPAYLQVVRQIMNPLSIQKLQQTKISFHMVNGLTLTHLPDDVGWLQLADGEDILGNGTIKVPLAANKNMS